MTDADLPDLVRALVIAGDVSTPYLSAGRGAPVLVLSISSSFSAAVLRVLPRRFRGLAPTVPSGIAAAGVAAWLEGFLDALGISLAWAITDAGFAHAAVGDRVRIAGVAGVGTPGNANGDDAVEQAVAASVARIDGFDDDPLTGVVHDLS